MECTFCKQIKIPNKEIKYPCFPCDICKSLICIECSDLSPTEVRWIPLQKKVLQFKCRKCRTEVVEILQNTIQDKDNIIKLLQEKIEILENQAKEINHVASYASIVQMERTNSDVVLKKNYPEIIIKPKRKQEATKTKSDVSLCIDPTKLKVGVRNIRTIDSGGIKIKCQSMHETDVLKRNITEKLQNDYEVNLTKMRKPRIKITNFDQDMSEDEIKRSIFEQNHVEGDMDITFLRKNRNSSVTIFGECSAAAFKSLMNISKIYIGWGRYPVYEDINVLRCFKCQQFHHKQKNCLNELVCPICSDSHEEKSCPKTKKCCKNCKMANEKYKIKYNFEHSSTDPSCPSVKYHIAMLKNKIDYFS